LVNGRVDGLFGKRFIIEVVAENTDREDGHGKGIASVAR